MAKPVIIHHQSELFWYHPAIVILSILGWGAMFFQMGMAIGSLHDPLLILCLIGIVTGSVPFITEMIQKSILIAQNKYILSDTLIQKNYMK